MHALQKGPETSARLIAKDTFWHDMPFHQRYPMLDGKPHWTTHLKAFVQNLKKKEREQSKKKRKNPSLFQWQERDTVGH